MVNGKFDVATLCAAPVENLIPEDHISTTILFMQRLESPSAFVHIEAVATSSEKVINLVTWHQYFCCV
jgi:hypothetical protein